MFKKINDSGQKPEVVQSYLGLLSHGDANTLKEKVKAFQSPRPRALYKDID